MLILVFMQTMDSKIEEGNPAIEEAGAVKKDNGIEEFKAIKERSEKIEAELDKIMKKSKLIPLVLVLILINVLILDILVLPSK